eukprot:65390_1
MTELPTSTYTWKLDISKAVQRNDVTDGKYFQSPYFKTHGFKWYIHFYPNFKNKEYVQIFVRLLLLPPIASKIIVQRNCQVLETNTNYSRTDEFDKDTMNWGWFPTTLKRKAIQNITKFTIVSDITLLDVFDSNGKDITEQYATPTEQKLQAPLSIIDNKNEEHEIRLNSLTTQMDQMMKNISQIQNTLKDIQLQMN